MPSEIELCARRVRHLADAMLDVVDDERSAEHLGDALLDLHEALALLSRLLRLMSHWYATHGHDLYMLGGPPERPTQAGAQACARELRRTAEELGAVATGMGAAVAAAERLASRSALRLTPAEAEHLASRGAAVYVVRHVSFATALSWESGFCADEALACWDAARLAADLPVGDVAQVALHEPGRPEPALHTYPGTAQPRGVAT